MDDCFARQYWDYQFAVERQLHRSFRDRRAISLRSGNAAINSGAGSLPAWAVEYSAGLAQPNFTAPAVREASATQYRARTVGGGGFRATAAQESPFFLHH